MRSRTSFLFVKTCPLPKLRPFSQGEIQIPVISTNPSETEGQGKILKQPILESDDSESTYLGSIGTVSTANIQECNANSSAAFHDGAGTTEVPGFPEVASMVSAILAPPWKAANFPKRPLLVMINGGPEKAVETCMERKERL